MEIRFAQPADVPGILNLLRQVGQVHHTGRPDLFQEGAQKYGASGVLSLMESPDTPVFVAAEDGKILGCCLCQIQSYHHNPVRRDYTTLWIDDFCVDRSCRRNHIGTALYNQVSRYAKGRKCQSVTLNVWAFNDAAIEFYKFLGLKPQTIGMETILEEG